MISVGFELEHQEIVEKIKKHDWWNQYKDDHQAWLRSREAESEIIVLLARVPMCDVPEIIKLYIPSEFREKIAMRLCLITKSELKNG